MIPSTTWQALARKGRVWNALAIREMMAKFGHGNIGFVWLVAEPLLLICGVLAAWSLTYGTSRHGVNIIPFVLTGYSMLTLWRHVVVAAPLIFSRSADLLYHRQISVLDIYYSRQLIEVVGIFVAFFVAYIPLALLDMAKPIDDYLVFIAAWLLMAFF